MKLHIVSAGGTLFNGTIHKVSFMTQSGMITVLPGHINLATILSSGKITYEVANNSETALDEFIDDVATIEVLGGLVTIADDVITVVIE